MSDETTDQVAVETNWILDVALHQDQPSAEMLSFAEKGQLLLFLPSFCIAEAIKRFESIQERWASLERALRKEKREILRSTHLQFVDEALETAGRRLAEVADLAEREFWLILLRITRAAHLAHV